MESQVDIAKIVGSKGRFRQLFQVANLTATGKFLKGSHTGCLSLSKLNNAVCNLFARSDEDSAKLARGVK
jgi:hypothetical protein